MSDGADCGRRDRHLTSAERSQRRKLGREKLVKAARDAASRATAAEKRVLALQEQLARALSDPSSGEDMAIDGEIRLREDLSRPALTAAILKKPLSGASRQQRNLAQHQARDGSRLDYGHHARSPVQVIGIGSSAEGGAEASESIKVLAARVTELETLVLAQSQSLARLSNYNAQLHQSSSPVLNNFDGHQAARDVEVPGGAQLSNHNAQLHQSSGPVLNNFEVRQATRDVEVPGGAQLSDYNAQLHQSSGPVLNHFQVRQAARDVEVPGGLQLSNHNAQSHQSSGPGLNNFEVRQAARDAAAAAAAAEDIDHAAVAARDPTIPPWPPDTKVHCSTHGKARSLMYCTGDDMGGFMCKASVDCIACQSC